MSSKIKRHSYCIISLLFLISTNTLSQTNSIVLKSNDKHTTNSPIKGTGSVSFDFIIPNNNSPWYELWLRSAPWPTDIYLDKIKLGHTSLNREVGPLKNREHKALNLYLKPGSHRLTFDRPYHPGLPYISQVSLRPANNISGMVTITPVKDHLVFRQHEQFSIKINAGQNTAPSLITLAIRDTQSSRIIYKTTQTIPKGVDQFQSVLELPTSKEGVFNLEATHKIHGLVTRPIQFIVIGTIANKNSSQLEKELIQTIKPISNPPDFISDTEFTITTSYIESGDKGVYQFPKNPDYFAYKLDLPSKHSQYLVEVDYPDNSERAFTISVIDDAINPYAYDSGVITGGHYTLSNSTQTHQLFFYPHTNKPRLLFLNWHSGQRIAVSEIRIYQITSPLPPLLSSPAERQFGMFFEEPFRFTTYFGAKPIGSEWTELYKTAQLWGEWSNYAGFNLWLQSIANYQAVMWPTDLLKGYFPADENEFGLLGPMSKVDPIQKDIVRLLLLTAEKYNISFIGELAIPMQGSIKNYLDKRFGGSGNSKINSLETPWLIVSDRGEIGDGNPLKPYLNPIHPKVQNWIAEIITELAERYSDSDSFKGIAIRLMSWAFASWQAFPSIHWGYGDFTIQQFEKETGIKIPVSDNDSLRYKKRAEWLTKTHYNDWVQWRCNKITGFYRRLSTILKQARPDLKLHINAFGPDYSQMDWNLLGGWRARYRKMQTIGWHQFSKESGIDPVMFKSEKNIIYSNSFHYPPGIRAKGTDRIKLSALERIDANNSKPIHLSEKSSETGTVSAVRFGNAYMEYNLPMEKIGYTHIKNNRKSQSARIVSTINPSSHHILRRYSSALAKGNITFMSDGGLGYILGQPKQLRPFLNEYYSLPAIGMSKLPANNNSVSLWHGIKDSTMYFYLVNDSDKKQTVKVTFTNSTDVIRLTTLLPQMINGKNLTITLKPYQLLAFENTKITSKPDKLTEM